MNEVREEKGGINIVLPIKMKVKGAGVIKRADGSVKYDDPSLKGTYGEDRLHQPEE